MRQATPKLSLVLLQTHVVAHLSKWTLRVLFLLGVLLSLAAQATAAPVVFEASGEFEYVGELSGTITIDTATGKVLSVDLILSGTEVGPGVYDVIPAREATLRSGPFLILRFLGIGNSLGLALRVPTLIGYEGGPIVSGLEPPEASGVSSFPQALTEVVEASDLGIIPHQLLVSGSLEPIE